MSITVRFACGHDGTHAINSDAAPICGCGETRVVRTVARAPRFVGACSGPYCETKAMEPGIVDLTTKGPLKLKESA